MHKIKDWDSILMYTCCDCEVTYIDLLRFKAFLEVVFFAFQAVDEFVKFFRFVRQAWLIHAVDIKWNNSLFKDSLFLCFQLFFWLLALLSFLTSRTETTDSSYVS